MGDFLARVFWGPWWGPDASHVQVHYAACAEVEVQKPIWMVGVSVFLNILLTVVLFGPPTQAASGATTFSEDLRAVARGGSSRVKDIGKGSFLLLALVSLAEDVREVANMEVIDGWRGWWARYECSSTVWATSPNFQAACTAVGLWYLAHVRLNYFNEMPYTTYGWVIERPPAMDKVNFTFNLRGWWLAFKLVLVPQGTLQALYISLLTIAYIVPLLLSVFLTHICWGMILYCIPCWTLYVLAKQIGDCMADRMYKWMEWRSGATEPSAPLDISVGSEAKATCDAVWSVVDQVPSDTCKVESVPDDTAGEKVPLGAAASQAEADMLPDKKRLDAHRQRRKQECELDWMSAGMDGAKFRELDDSELRMFLIHVRVPFTSHGEIIQRTKLFRSSGAYVDDTHGPCSELDPDDLEDILKKADNAEVRWMELTGAPRLAWRSYFFLVVALPILVPALLVTIVRFLRGDGYVAALWRTMTERTTVKYFQSLKEKMKKKTGADKLTGEVALFFTKTLWSWV